MSVSWRQEYRINEILGLGSFDMHIMMVNHDSKSFHDLAMTYPIAPNPCINILSPNITIKFPPSFLYHLHQPTTP